MESGMIDSGRSVIVDRAVWFIMLSGTVVISASGSGEGRGWSILSH